MGPKFMLQSFILITAVLLTACVPGGSEGLKSKRGSASNVTAPEAIPATGGSGVGNQVGGAGPNDGNVGSGNVGAFDTGVAELRHIVDPYDGNYKTKVSLPKNFSGVLYLSGINITSLSSKLVRARFRFGRELETITIPATIARGQGITPETDIQLVALDMSSQPFDDIRLLYDLFDYTNYRDSNGSETVAATSDPRGAGLYCRGLKLTYDPTFQGSSSNGRCDATGEKCNFAYAKVVDSGLVNAAGITQIVSEPQIDLIGNGYTSDSDANALKKCLPDNNSRTNFNNILNTNVGAGASPAYGTEVVSLNGANYTYFGPFRAINESEWEISGGALLSAVASSTEASGLFQASYNAPAIGGGYNSFLFPRAGKIKLQAGVEHFSSATALLTASSTSRTKTSLASSGETNFMNGCSIRAMNVDPLTQEGISSCNVTAKIELVTIDQTTGAETVLAVTSKVKLQLIRPSEEDTLGNDILYTSLPVCSSNQACGANECCFNNRCWSNELIAQCPSTGTIIGHKDVGQNCGSDFDCSSLCCNQGAGTCAHHINTEAQKVLCSKSPGQQCVAREWCRQEPISKCYVVKTGIDLQGQTTCARRCYYVPTFGECVNGLCRPPISPTPEPFDPSNPDCSSAHDAQEFDNLINQ